VDSADKTNNESEYKKEQAALKAEDAEKEKARNPKKLTDLEKAELEVKEAEKDVKKGKEN